MLLQMTRVVQRIVVLRSCHAHLKESGRYWRQRNSLEDTHSHIVDTRLGTVHTKVKRRSRKESKMRLNECEDVKGSGAKPLTFRISMHATDDQSSSAQRFDLCDLLPVIILAIDGYATERDTACEQAVRLQ